MKLGKNCWQCPYNDGSIYTSIPPRYKCTVTHKFHFGSDECDVEKEVDPNKKEVAQDILNYIKMVCFSNEWVQYRINHGSHGVRDIIIQYIKNTYGVE